MDESLTDDRTIDCANSKPSMIKETAVQTSLLHEGRVAVLLHCNSHSSAASFTDLIAPVKYYLCGVLEM